MKRRRAPLPWAAQKAREVLEIRRILEPSQIDLRALFDDHRLVLRRALIGNAEGRLVRSGRCGVVTIDESCFASEKWRFVAAHELGHWLLHEHRSELACFSKPGATRRDKTRSFFEEEGASGFAVELITPCAMVQARCDSGASPAERAKRLTGEFVVSLPVASLRVLDFTDEPCAVAYSEAGVVRWCTATSAFAVKVTDRRPVPKESSAVLARASSDVVGHERTVPASVWGVSGGVYELREHAMAIPGFDAVVTMLWHERTAA